MTTLEIIKNLEDIVNENGVKGSSNVSNDNQLSLFNEEEKTNESTQEEMQNTAERVLNNSTYGAYGAHGRTESDSQDYGSLLDQLNNLQYDK